MPQICQWLKVPDKVCTQLPIPMAYKPGLLVQTDEKGNYSIPLDFNKLYTLTITKEGYNTNILMIDTRALPSGK